VDGCVESAVVDFVASRNFAYHANAVLRTFYDFNFDNLVYEIDHGRPAIINVDADGDGYSEHYVTAIGYDDATNEYAVYNTWDHDIHWYQWHLEQAGNPFGLYGIITVTCTSSGIAVRVPEDYPTIQAGINAAMTGDTVLVNEGIYTGPGNYNLNVGLESIVITSVNGPEYTIIDLQNVNGRFGFHVNNNQNPYTEISGFTIRGGRSSYYGTITIWDSSPRIANNIITANNNENGAISAEGPYCSPLIINNTICGNKGGIKSNSGANTQIKNTIIWENYDFEVIHEYHAVNTATYSIIRKGCEGSNNLKVNPLIVDINGGDLNVFQNSPCIDGGDPAITDPDDSRSDIGAFFKNHPEYQDNGEVIRVAVTGSDETGDGSASNPYRTTQKGMQVSRHGDTVLVSPGHYYFDTDFYGKNVVLASQYLHSGDIADIENTIIWRWPLNSSIIRFESYETDRTVLYGLTFTGSYSLDHGGAVYCFEADPTIMYNIFYDNTANFYGGGVYLMRSNSRLVGNIFYNNTAGWMGGGIYSAESDLIIENCTIYGNTANEFCAGLYDWYSNITAVNTIIYGNHASILPDIYTIGGSYDFTYCDIGGGRPGVGNIDAEPMFCDAPAGDFHLDGNSPCVGAGSWGACMGARGIGCGDMKTAIVPDSMHIKDADLVDPMTASIYFGNFFIEHSAGDVDPLTVMVNDTIVPLNIELISVYDSFVGELWKIDFPIRGFIKGYGLIWDTKELEYNVTGQWNTGEPFDVTGIIRLTGHKTGDINYDNQVNVLDILYLINAQFHGGLPPDPPSAADFDCSEQVNILDIITLVNYVFKNGPTPLCP